MTRVCLPAQIAPAIRNKGMLASTWPSAPWFEPSASAEESAITTFDPPGSTEPSLNSINRWVDHGLLL